jgi:hypothetical protein
MKIGMMVLVLAVGLAACGDSNDHRAHGFGKQEREEAADEVAAGYKTRGPANLEADARDYEDMVFMSKYCPSYKKPFALFMEDKKLTNREARLLYLAVMLKRKEMDKYEARRSYYEARAATDPSYKMPKDPGECQTFVSDTAVPGYRGHIAFERTGER